MTTPKGKTWLVLALFVATGGCSQGVGQGAFESGRLPGASDDDEDDPSNDGDDGDGGEGGADPSGMPTTTSGPTPDPTAGDDSPDENPPGPGGVGTTGASSTGDEPGTTGAALPATTSGGEPDPEPDPQTTGDGGGTTAAAPNDVGNCCDTHGGTGCTVPAIETCVCDDDAFCCATEWDSFCVNEVDSFGCGMCPP